jgi:phosphohistidine phosphatase
MKKLILIRHGKAEDGSFDISDFERSLVTKGKIISHAVAREMKTREKSPGLIVTSPAFRAFETAVIFAAEFGVQPEAIVLNSKIYNKLTISNLPDILSEDGENTDSIWLVGHNPVFSDLANALSENGCESMPKSGVICLTFRIDKWKDLKNRSGKLEYFLKP